MADTPIVRKRAVSVVFSEREYSEIRKAAFNADKPLATWLRLIACRTVGVTIEPRQAENYPDIKEFQEEIPESNQGVTPLDPAVPAATSESDMDSRLEELLIAAGGLPDINPDKA